MSQTGTQARFARLREKYGDNHKLFVYETADGDSVVSVPANNPRDAFYRARADLQAQGHSYHLGLLRAGSLLRFVVPLQSPVTYAPMKEALATR